MAEEVTNVISWKFQGDASDLEAAISAAESSFKDLGVEAERTEKKTDGVTGSTDKAASSFDRAKAAGRAYGGRLGELGEKLDNVQIAMGGAASSATLMAAAVAGGAAAAVGYVVVVNGLVIAAAAAADELHDLGLVTDEQKESLDDAAESATRLGRQFKALGVVAISSLAPRIEKVNTAIFGIMDAVSQLGSTGTISIDRMAERWENLNGVVSDTNVSVQTMLSNILEIEEGGSKTASRRAAAAAVLEKAGETRVEQLRTDVALAKELAEIADKDAARRARLELDGFKSLELVKEMETIRLEGIAKVAVAERSLSDEITRAAAERIKILEGEADTRAKIGEDNQARIMGELVELNEFRNELAEEESERTRAAIDLANDGRRKAADEEKALDKAVFDAKADLAMNLVNLAEQLAGDNVAVQKGVGIAGVLIESAVAVMSAFKEPAPVIPFKLAAIAAATAASIAAIASVSKDGGGATASASAPSFGRAGGEGKGGGFATSPGDGGGGGTFIMLGNEVFDAQTRRALRRDSELDRAIRRRGGAQSRLGFVGDS